jgi:hypothetical protein
MKDFFLYCVVGIEGTKKSFLTNKYSLIKNHMKLSEIMQEKKYMVPLAVGAVIIVAGVSYAAFGEKQNREERVKQVESKYEESANFTKSDMRGEGKGKQKGSTERKNSEKKMENSGENEYVPDEHQPPSAEEHKAQDEKMINDLPKEDLSEAEIDALTLMGEEEYLARDVYRALYEKWGIQSFNNIQKSEQNHAQAITILQEKYGLETFSDHKEGVFKDEHIQNLYNDLVKKGLQSEVDALQVGMTIEDLDIYDLEKLSLEVDNKDIQKVFDNLTRGSRNHMRAFNRQLVKYGGEYEAQYISPEKMQEIITGDHEPGDHAQEMVGKSGQSGGEGQGKGRKGGNGGGQGMGYGRMQ